MGAPDGAKVCEMCCLYILAKMAVVCPELNFGLYRDDGLASHGRITKKPMEALHKKIKTLFRDNFGLSVKIEKSEKIVNFLDVTFNLTSGKYKPYRKPNDTPLYVNTRSSHPPNVIKQVPLGINKRLADISSTKVEFEEAKPAYQEALTASGHAHKLEYKETPNPPTPARRKRKQRRIHWFNPPYNASVATNIGKKFLGLIDKYFPKSNPLNQVFNRNTVKISYSCTRNMKAVIQGHNKKLLSQHRQAETEQYCNCQVSKKDFCPLNGKCFPRTDVVYEATTNETPARKYIGSTKNFKARYGGHKQNFKNWDQRKATALSKHVWEEGLGIEPNLKWKILTSAPHYKAGGRSCNLCLTEKHLIMRNSRDPAYLNRRAELSGKCRHMADARLDQLS